MVDTGIFATTAEVSRKAGENADATANLEAYINQFMTEAESFINVATKINWSDTYTTLNADVKGILKEAASNLAAIYVILFNMAGFTSRSEAETMINVLYSRAMDCIDILKENQDFVITPGTGA